MHVVIIGSGFGGSIAAKRFTEAGHTVELLEMGEDWRDLTGAKQSSDPDWLFRLMRDYPADYMRRRPKLLIAQGMGLGGGSLVYSGIHLRAPAQAFDGWPDGYTRAALDPYYDRVEARLGIAPLPGAAEFPRSRAFAEGARAAGLPPARPNPLALSGCVACGWCVPLCIYGKKTTLAHTYLVDAARTGRLTIRTRRKAAYIARAGNRFRVACWKTEHVERDYHRVTDGDLVQVEGDRVVVACGAIESPALLQRSLRADVPRGSQPLRTFEGAGSLGSPADPLSLAPHAAVPRAVGIPPGKPAGLGRGIDGTGDFIQGGFVPRIVDGFKGSVMMMHVDAGDFVVEDVHGIPIGATVILETRPRGVAKPWGLDYVQRYADFGRHMLAIGVIGKQGGDTAGNIVVRDEGGIAVPSADAYLPPPGALEAARSIITSLGGEVADSPWEVSKTAFTVHPVGGCRLGDVVSADTLTLRENPGIHVIDGSVLPGGPFRNPAHTIAAIAERALDTIVR